MPEFWAHSICANVTLQQLEQSPVADIINRHTDSFLLGSQGSDLLYFRPLHLLRGRKGIVYLATRLHRQPLERIAASALRMLDGIANEQQFEIAFAYVCGFITHHAVDQRVHPLINGHTNRMLRHRRIELDFDTYLARQLDQMPAGRRAWSKIDGFDDFQVLHQWYNRLLTGLRKKPLKVSAFKRAYKNMKRASYLLNRPARLGRPRHAVHPLLAEEELQTMLEQALLGSADAACIIEELHCKLGDALPVPALPAVTARL